MMKDGRPSRINDIRYFFGDKHTYLEGQEEAVAFGRRIAWFLNGEGFSLGAYPALYVYFTTSLAPGAVEVTDYGGEWWQRYTHVGVTTDFPTDPRSPEIVIEGTISALKAIKPDLSKVILDAEQIVRAEGDKLRFLIKTRETKKHSIDISFSISVWPQSSFLFASMTEKATGVYLEAPPVPLQFYLEAFDLAGGVKVTDAVAQIVPNQSVAGSVTSARHDGPLVATLVSAASRPVVSKLVSRRG